MATSVRIQVNSRLRFADWVVVDEIEFWNLLELPDIPEQPDDVLHTVTRNDRLDLLARDYYGDSVLKFIIAQANDIEVEPTQLNVGDEILIPSPRYVREEHFKRKAKF